MLAQKLIYSGMNQAYRHMLPKNYQIMLKAATIFFCGLFFSLNSFAQDTSYSTTTTTESEQLWYLQPWVWVAGGVVLLLLLIALFSGGKKKNNNYTRTDKVIITKTVRTESDAKD